MADLKALVTSGGRTQQIANADSLLVGTGIKGNAGPLSIGTVGQLTTVLGDFQVDGTETIVGGTTFQSDATFQGNVTFGNAATDTVAFISRVGPGANPDVHFLKEVNHTIDVDASTTAATAGGSLTIASGDGNGAAGGALSLDTGTGTAGGALSIGATDAASVAIGHSGITTTVTGNLAQLTGTLNLNATGTAVVDASTSLTLGGTNATSIAIGHSGITSTFAAGSAVVIPASNTTTAALTLNSIAYQFPAAQAAGQVLTTDGAGVLTWTTAATGTVTGTGVANRIAYWTSASNISNDANLLFDPAGAASIDATTSLTLGGTNATSVAIGHSGITTTVTGSLAQLTGTLNLNATGIAVVDASTSLTLGGTNATSVAIGHSGITTTVTGNLVQLTGTLNLNATGTAVVDASTSLTLGGTNATSIAIGHSGITTTFAAGSAVVIPASNTTTAALTLNSLAYQFPTTQSAGAVLTTDGAGVLTWSSSGSISQLTISGQTTTGLGDGDFAYVSAANTWSKAQNDGTDTQSVAVAVNEGTVGSMSLPGSVIENAKFTTAGGSPAIGAEVFLAAAADDGATGAGKATATAPTATGSFLTILGVCVNDANYAGSKTAKIIFRPMSPILL